jgi:hypothetical protein
MNEIVHAHLPGISLVHLPTPVGRKIPIQRR